MLMQFDAVSRAFPGPSGRVQALDGVSFGVEPGAFVAICGPSGCGKSTLLLIGGALLRPTAGRVMVAGCEVYTATAAEQRRLRASTLGFVFQQFHLVPYLSVWENLLAPSLALSLPGASARAEALLERFGLSDRRDHLPAQLSTGEKQRTALARALLNEPKVLLADEPTGNLDSGNSAVVLEALAAFARSGGAVLMVTHNQDAARRADRVLHMERGRLV